MRDELMLFCTAMKIRGLLLLACLALPFSLFADDGLWMPQQIPALGGELKKLGLQLDPNQFADLTGFPMGAIVSIPGCSASFVSPDGLIVSNHHCVYGALQYNSTKEHDYVRDGFLAKTRAEEIQATPDARVYVTTAIDDVTAQILGTLPKNTTDAERARAITRNRRRIVEECEKQGNVRCLVSSFFEGAQYLRFTQLELRDVRLVYAPALGVGNFGDEVDNWMWPRHTGDFGFYRAYVGKDGKPADYSKDNVPYRPKHFLKVSTRDLDENDLVMIAGTPGSTSRHATASQVQAAEEYELPAAVRYRTMLLDLLRARGAGDRDVALRNASRIASLENYLKKYTGTLEAYRRGHFVEAKKKEEAALRASLTGELAKSYDTASAELESILARQRTTRERDTLFAWLYTASPMLTQANNLYRNTIERTRPDLDRADEYRDRNRTRFQGSLTRNRRNFDLGSDRAGLRLFLAEAAKLPADQRITPVDRALHKTTVDEQIDALLDRLYGSTKIGDAEAEAAMVNETTAQLTARNDSLIAFAAELRAFGAQRDEETAAREGAMARLRPVMLEALRAARGGRLYPDANGTLRVGFGQVKGYSPRNGVWYFPQTDVRGVVEKEKGEEPFNSPATLLRKAGEQQFGSYVDPDLHTVPVAFLSTTNVTNGSSGSATLNAWRELCGLAFDMNWEGVGADYMVEEDLVRTIHVDSRYMLWVMDAVDGAHELLREMGVQPQFEGGSR
ncbi:MAG TPA: S46 family peptidase [Thermoanaerobaculia bacterium]|jgi:hypothetical protein